LMFDNVKAPTGKSELRPGPLRISLENRADVRVLPAIWVAGDKLHELLGRRRPFLTAKHLLTNQTFRDVYRANTLDVDQRLKITSLTFPVHRPQGFDRALRAGRRSRGLRS